MLVKTLASYINLDLWTKSLIFIVYVLLPAVLGKYGGSFRVCDQLSIGLRFPKAGGKQPLGLEAKKLSLGRRKVFQPWVE